MFIINVKQHRAHLVALLLTIGHLCHEVRKIGLGLHMGRQYLTHRNSLADTVVANGQVLLFQC
jgi:hypothetical protein